MNPFLIPDEEDYYDFDELDFETSPTIIHRGDLTDRVQRMRQVISDEDLDRALLGLVNIAEEDQSHGGDDILWVDLYICIYRLVPYIFYGARLVDTWDELYDEYLPVMHDAFRFGNSDAVLYAEIVSYILGRAAYVEPDDRPGNWEEEHFVSNLQTYKPEPHLPHPAQPTVASIWESIVMKYDEVEHYKDDLDQIAEDGSHFEDPTDMGVGFTLNSLVTDWYHEGTDRFREIREFLGVTENNLLSMNISPFVKLLGEEVWNLPEFPPESLMISAFQSKPGMILKGQEFLMIAPFYDDLEENNMTIADWWDFGRAFPMGEWEGFTELDEFDLSGTYMVCAVLWDTIQNSTYDVMLDDKIGV